jgi:hypothetical protein
MKPKTLNSIVITLLTLSGPLYGQSFDAGSDGSLGDVVIATSTNLDLPPDGKLNFKSLTINGGATLGFNRNARNTPAYILSQTEIVVNGTITVDGATRTVNTGGAGGPGGFDGGKPGFGAEAPPGDGYGPGGGHSGVNSCSDETGTAEGGGYGTTRSAFSGSTYGNTTLIPLIGGSGGGGGANDPNGGGGGGGGAIMLAANNRVAVNGTIFARGGGGGFCLNGGSGGAIRLVSFKVEGAGLLDARSQGNAGQGRLRVDTVIRTSLNFNLQGASTIGGNLLVFPPTVPSLAVIQAAGNNIPEGSNPVGFTLPFGSSTNRTIRIQARDFGRNLPIRVTLTPDSGAKRVFDAAVDNTAVNPAVVDVPVTVPVNTLVTVQCWTR